MGKEHNDEELMLNYRHGDASAFEVLYQRHKGALYRYILRQCGNESTAEELFQDVWIKLISARERYQVRARFTTWLYQMAHNRLIDHYRRQKTSNLGDSESDVESLQTRTQDQPEHRAELQEQSCKLLELLNALPIEQREALILREEAGKSVQEIAAITGVNAETAKSRLRYAVNKLRQIFNE